MKKSISLLLVIVIIQSCAPVLNYPNAVNVPMLENRGEGNIAVGTNFEVGEFAAGKQGIFDQFEINSSYAVSDKIGIQINGAYINPKANREKVKVKDYIAEVGVGYYKRISPKFIFETYGLLGFGAVDNAYFDHTQGFIGDISFDGTLKANFVKLGIQPSIAYKRRKFFYSLATRLYILNFSNISGDLKTVEKDIAQRLKDHPNFNLYIDPAFTIGYNFKRIRLQFQAGGSMSTSDYNFGQGGFGSITIGYRFGQKE